MKIASITQAYVVPNLCEYVEYSSKCVSAVTAHTVKVFVVQKIIFNVMKKGEGGCPIYQILG